MHITARARAHRLTSFSLSLIARETAPPIEQTYISSALSKCPARSEQGTSKRLLRLASPLHTHRNFDGSKKNSPSCYTRFELRGRLRAIRERETAVHVRLYRATEFCCAFARFGFTGNGAKVVCMYIYEGKAKK